MGVVISRTFAMPNAETFSVVPIGDFVRKYMVDAKLSVDPFARNKEWFTHTHTNDLDPSTNAQKHMDAQQFLGTLRPQYDLGIFDRRTLRVKNDTICVAERKHEYPWK